MPSLSPFVPPRGTPYNGIYRESTQKECLFQASVILKVGILQTEVYERVGKSVI